MQIEPQKVTVTVEVNGREQLQEVLAEANQTLSKLQELESVLDRVIAKLEKLRRTTV